MTLIDYLENILIPTLEKGDIVIMDNMRSHHVKKVAEVMETAFSSISPSDCTGWFSSCFVSC